MHAEYVCKQLRALHDLFPVHFLPTKNQILIIVWHSQFNWRNMKFPSCVFSRLKLRGSKRAEYIRISISTQSKPLIIIFLFRFLRGHEGSVADCCKLNRLKRRLIVKKTQNSFFISSSGVSFPFRASDFWNGFTCGSFFR